MHLKKGVNFGMWLAQYPAYSPEYFANYISCNDFQRAAALGFDHIRLPFDYAILEDDANPFHYRESGLRLLDQAIADAKNSGLTLILDLHRAPGYIFDRLHESTLFDSAALQQRFVALWVTLAQRYKNQGNQLIFELLNEVVEPDSSRWNALAERTVGAIRAIDQERVVVVGGNSYSAVAELTNTWLSNDPAVWYTFHYYEPLLVTHPHAHWNDFTKAFDRQVPYPGRANGLPGFIEQHPNFAPQATDYLEEGCPRLLDRSVLAKGLLPAKDFRLKTGKLPFCGEFGVYEHTDQVSCLNWSRDMVELLGEMGLPWTWWNWKSDDFGLFKINGSERIEGLLDILLDVPTQSNLTDRKSMAGKTSLS